MQQIYIQVTDIPLEKSKTRKQFLRNFLRSKNISSYLDVECKILQCSGTSDENPLGISRSVSDMYNIIKSRFPNTSFEMFCRLLGEFINEDKSVSLLWCNKINKIVIKYQPHLIDNPTKEWITQYSKRNYYDREGDDGISFKKLEKLLKIQL